MKKLTQFALVGLLTVSSFSMAGMHSGDKMCDGKAKHQKQMVQKLNLTEAQQTQMKAVCESMQAERQAARTANQEAMQAFMNSPKFDAAQAEKLVDKRQNERAVMKMKMVYEMNKILTPEQRAEQQKMMQDHQNKKNKKNN